MKIATEKALKHNVKVNQLVSGKPNDSITKSAKKGVRKVVK